MAAPLAFNQLALIPLGAGDLIDRAVRLYRRHFLTLIRIAAPPVIISAIGTVMMTLSNRSGELTGGDVLLAMLGLLLWAGGMLLNMIVMGGAARNLITHLLWDEPFSARTTYRNVRARFWSLLGAALIIAIWVAIAFVISVIIWALIMQFVIRAAIMSSHAAPLMTAVIGIMGTLMVTVPVLIFFFFAVKFIVYVPQVIMIEGRGVFDAIGRSVMLARSNLRRLMAMFLFYWFATWSALMVLLIPLLWYGNAQGVNIMPNQQETWPVWYAIGYNVLTQVSAILLVPILMLGLSLLYLDDRVRQEGYDVELIAARQLGGLPGSYGGPHAPYPSRTMTQSHPYGAAQATVSPPQTSPPGPTLNLR
jgi:hypothetical protein